ncbi:MAG TPA: GGDEF domain-containing protein [Candidatus Onthousia excrementipullorum]|uniref:GGDEF domain-containing protein n=1 Tax=Candidatus Onthousia excrementipullorum TaxID=2840884 RepID=A0A9D1DUQ8_9FIRM|nr:GGDEF domain-containing protein [Candidatus Onthousia excrementipullorum]
MKKKLLIILPLLVVVIVFVGVFFYYNREDAKTSLTVNEKKWALENSTTMIDINVINDYPLYGLNGEGVFFNFLDDFEKNVGLEFNKIAYSKNDDLEKNKAYSFRILNNEDELSNNDLLIATDGYIAIGKEYRRINRVSDMSNITFGVFNSDVAEISYYLKTGTNLAFKSYDTIDELFQALDNDEVGMIIIPNIMYLDKTIENNSYYINYYFTEMSKKIVLTLSSDKSNARLNTIIRKYFEKWKTDNYVDEYNDVYFNYYITENNVSSKDSTDLVKKNYVYGYVENYPYEVDVDGDVSGIAGEYLKRMSRLTDISFSYKKYGSIEALRKAIEKGDVDIYFDYYNFNNVNDDYKETISTFIEDYVVLGRRSDNHVVNSFESLKDEKIAMLDNTSLYNYFENNSRSDITTYDNNNDLVKNANDKMLVVDKEVYNLYKNTTFEDYDVLYQDTMMNDYKFMVKNNNNTFYNLFNYIITTNSYYNYRNNGLADISRSIVERSSFMGLFLIILIIVSVPLIALAFLYLYFKRRHKIKKVKKEDRHKYTDLLTSLKNRNYLNKKAPDWEASKVFPQAVVIIDLNNVKYVNDNYGHEEGDKLIVTAASTLVNTQLENSEIIRTDGNEFLVYLVGYSERQVETYAKKLEKEMKNLPHDFGASVGYSMILDDIKTLDDAINEATLEMMTKKQGLK